MKMKKRELQPDRSTVNIYGDGGGGGVGVSKSMSNGKAKIWNDEEQDPGGMDELLAVLGYKVRSSDMADVAQQLEELEMVMGTALEEDGMINSHFSYNTVHYNPSDISGWVQNLLSEVNNSSTHIQNPLHFQIHNQPQSSTIQSCSLYNDDSAYDLSAIPGVAALPPRDYVTENEKSRKRLKTSSIGSTSLSFSGTSSSEVSRPVVVVDSQETGIRLVHTLMACAEAVQQENMKLAEGLVKHIRYLAESQSGAMGKVATYFAEALDRRITKIFPQDTLYSSYSNVLQNHFYETCPYLKFAHFTANQAILEAFSTASRVHVIDFSLNQGMQWPVLMQALALRPGGPPSFRLTGIGPPKLDNTDSLQQVGSKLAQLAAALGVEFEFRDFVCSNLADLDPAILDIRPAEEEAVAVNSVFDLHRLVARPGAMDKVLDSIKTMNPKIVTIVEQEANHNGPVFLDRFTEALHYYSNLFDSLEGSSSSTLGMEVAIQDFVLSEMYLGREIFNVVACEGEDRVERHETLSQWKSRMGSAGFEPVHLGSNAFKQASMLLALFAGGDGYRVEENNGCLMLGWHTRPLIATSAWQLATKKS